MRRRLRRRRTDDALHPGSKSYVAPAFAPKVIDNTEVVQAVALGRIAATLPAAWGPTWEEPAVAPILAALPTAGPGSVD